MKYEGEVRELELITALVELGSESFTGALRFENDSIIKIVYFKDGSVLSASTNDRSDSIDEILLKSGKVSREHVKQALSKRKDDESLGDALLGLGFITRKELSWARRVQLVGVLRSIMTWDSGQYTLVADYLPKREEGPAFPLEQVVLELVLTDADRTKYDALLDSGAAVFRPSPEFEEKFPNLGLNQEAEAVVRLINGSRTASEVVAESTSDAFNVYKLMHALKLLGLLEKSQSTFDAGPTGSPIQPTIELPMDFEASEPEKPTEPSMDFDLGAPSASPPVTSDELLPSIELEDTGGSADASPDYAPSVPDDGYPRMDSESVSPALESLSSLEIPVPSVTEPEPEPAPRKTYVQKASGGGGGGGGRKAAFLVVGIVMIAALAYASYVYFTRPGDEGAPVAEQTQQPEPTAGASADGTTETPVDNSVTPEVTTSEPPVEVEPEPVVPKQPQPAETTTPRQAPPPAATPPAKPATGRYAELARQNARNASGVPYTIQFALLCQEYSVENAIKVGGSDFWFVPITYQGRNCFRALWGRYPTREEAERNIANIPTSLRGGKAVVIEPSKL